LLACGISTGRDAKIFWQQTRPPQVVGESLLTIHVIDEKATALIIPASSIITALTTDANPRKKLEPYVIIAKPVQRNTKSLNRWS